MVCQRLRQDAAESGRQAYTRRVKLLTPQHLILAVLIVGLVLQTALTRRRGR